MKTKFISLRTLQLRHSVKNGGNLNILTKPPIFATLDNINVSIIQPFVVRTGKKNLSQYAYELFINDYADRLVALEYSATDSEQIKGLKKMLRQLGPFFADDYSLLYLDSYYEAKRGTVASFYNVISIGNYTYLLFKNTMNIGLVKEVEFTPIQKYTLLYRVVTKLYVILNTIKKSKSFHRNIDISSVYIKENKLGNGQIDFNVYIGDFSLFALNTPKELSTSTMRICDKPIMQDQFLLKIKNKVCINHEHTDIANQNVNLLWDAFTCNFVVLRTLVLLRLYTKHNKTEIDRYVLEKIDNIKKVKIHELEYELEFEDYIIDPLVVKTMLSNYRSIIDNIAIDALDKHYKLNNIDSKDKKYFDLDLIDEEVYPELYILSKHLKAEPNLPTIISNYYK